MFFTRKKSLKLPSAESPGKRSRCTYSSLALRAILPSGCERCNSLLFCQTPLLNLPNQCTIYFPDPQLLVQMCMQGKAKKIIRKSFCSKFSNCIKKITGQAFFWGGTLRWFHFLYSDFSRVLMKLGLQNMMFENPAKKKRSETHSFQEGFKCKKKQTLCSRNCAKKGQKS